MSWTPTFSRSLPAEVVDPLTVKPPFPAGRGPGSLAFFKEQESDVVGVVSAAALAEDDGETLEALVGEALAVFEDKDVGETVGLPGVSVVLSADVVSTPSISVTIIVVPSVTVVSGTPTSGVGDGETVWAAD
jgi:hypothetical protein